MKTRKHEKLIFAKRGGWWMRVAFVLAKAFHYGRAARHDEQNGYPYAAAMEWRQAAELFVSSSIAADYCWWQWERIMRLPRRFAVPVSNSRHVVVPPNPISPQPAMNQGQLATAA